MKPPGGATRLPILLGLTACVWAVSVAPAPAQSSASYTISDHTLNEGGNPNGGAVLTSTSYRISLDSVGDGIVRAGLGSASYHMDGSFTVCYPPPGEVGGLRFTDATTLVWDAERSVGDYDLYRDALSSLSGGSYGSCLQHDLPGETATDGDPVPGGDGFFYLVTAENRLDEEGTKGSDSAGAERGGGVCP